MGSWAQAITSGVGRAGAETGSAVDQNIGTALQVIQQRLMAQEVQQRLRESEVRLKQASTPQTQYFPTPGAGTVALQTAPFSNAPMGAPQTVVPGQNIPKTAESAWLESKTQELGHPPSSQQIEAHEQESKNPLNSILWQGIDAARSGDMQTAQSLFQLGATVRGVQKGPTTPSVMSLVMDAQAGKPGAQQALQSYMNMQVKLAEARGEGSGKGRSAYQIGAYMDPDTGQVIAMSNLDAIEAMKNGKNLVPSGRLPVKDAIAVQQLQSEAPPAMAGVRKYIKAFDNASDRAIFARVLANNPAATAGHETEWLGQIINQAVIGGLSDDGQHLVNNLNTLNESVGRVRGVLGLPSTERMVAMTLALVPGPSTPDSHFATLMLDNLQRVIDNASNIPALRGAGAGAKGGVAGGPPPGAVVRDYDPATGTVK